MQKDEKPDTRVTITNMTPTQRIGVGMLLGCGLLWAFSRSRREFPFPD